MNYGMPYKGGKSGIAERLIEIIPSAETFVDAFAGGCAMTHCAMLSGKYKKFVCNDIGPYPAAFLQCIKGLDKEKYLTHFVERDEFEASTDPIIKMVWSFGNNCRDYLFGRGLVTDAKRALWKKRVNGDPSEWERLQSLQSLERLERLQSLERLQRLQRLQSLQSLERLQSLESLQSIQSLEIQQTSYDKLTIPENSIVYCDPPYAGTDGYGCDFDSDKFFDWAVNLCAPVFVSEYKIDDPRLRLVAEFEKRVDLGHSGLKKKERLCANAVGYEMANRQFVQSELEFCRFPTN